MTERKRYQAKVGGNFYEFSGAAYIYDSIGDKIGISAVSERSSGAAGTSNQIVISQSETVKRVLPKVKIVMVRDGVGNSAQVDSGQGLNRTRTSTVLCDPDKVDDALTKLPNSRVGGVGVGGGATAIGDWRIVRAYLPLKRCFV